MKLKDDISHQALLAILPELNTLTKLENESTTRLRAIDTILFDVLSWDKAAVETEKYCRSEGYADYVFTINGRPCIILEAKRAGIDFIMPDRSLEDRPYAFGILGKECPKAISALNQAIGYAAALGSRYVAISNGHQWLFSLTFVQGEPLERRLVYVFESLESISSRFRSFHSCFSREGIAANAVSRDLIDTLKLPPPAKLSSRIPGYPTPASRNVFQNELSYILDYVWQIMSQEEGTKEFVENCYVNPTSHEDILALVRELIEKRKNEDDILRHYEIQSADKLPHEIAHLPAQKPFIVLGEIGRGKSSFLKYLRFISAKEHLINYLQIELDFIDRPDNESEIPDFVYSQIEAQLRDRYSIDIYEDGLVRGVLHGDLQRLKRSPKGVLYHDDKSRYREFELAEIEKFTKDRHAYLTKVVHHLKKGRQCSIALFLDNLDRRDIGIQEQAFLKASAIARDWASLVFICLRPDTYYKSQRNGVLDAIAPTAFTVGQPDLSLVLKRRFAYAKKMAEGESLGPELARTAPSRNISFDLPSVARIFESCEFAAWKRHGIIPTLEAVSNGNIRRLLDFARRILCSGHLDTGKILRYIEQSGRYSIPDFEGVKALLYGDYMHYDPSVSPFINLFDLRHGDPSEHFMNFLILHYLAKFPQESPDRGYESIGQLLLYMSTLGYSFNTALEGIKALMGKLCVRRPVDADSSLQESDKVRISSFGRYHLFSLASDFQYLDAMIIDTPILDEEIRNKMADVSDINLRLERMDNFLEYLNSCASHIQDKEFQPAWQEILSQAKANVKEIRDRVEGN
jgi:hypothetical protein